MEVTNKDELKRIKESLENLKSDCIDCIKLEEIETNTDMDIYSKIQEVIECIEEIEEGF